CLGNRTYDDGVVHRLPGLGIGLGAGTHDDRVLAPAHRLLADGHAARIVSVAAIAKHSGIFRTGTDVVANRHGVVCTSIHARRVTHRQRGGATCNRRRANGHGVVGSRAVIGPVGIDGGAGAEVLHAAFRNGLVELLDVDGISGRGAGCNVADTPYGVVAHGIHRKDVNIAAG